MTSAVCIRRSSGLMSQLAACYSPFHAGRHTFRFLVASSGSASAEKGLQVMTLKRLNCPIPMENIICRRVTMADKQAVLAIEPDVHYGLDYLPDYYDELVCDSNKYPFVAADRTSDDVLAFGYTIIGFQGRTLSTGGGRTVRNLRSYGLINFTIADAFKQLKSRLHPQVTCFSVYNLPKYNREYFEKRHDILKVVLHNHQLGFECQQAYWSALADRFAANPPSAEEPKLVANPVDFLSSESVCSATENRLLKPDQHFLIAKEATCLCRENLAIFGKRLAQVMASQSPESPSSSSSEITGVSIGNWNSVPAGGYHLTINIYCRTEASAVNHIVGQIRSASQSLRLHDANKRLYISAYVPSHLFYNEVLSGVRVHPILRDLPNSLSPKLACDIRIVSWRPGDFV